MRVGVYPGSFDPITIGHLDVIKRSSRIFDKIIVLICVNSSKRYLFDTQTKVKMVEAATNDFPSIEVAFYDGMLIDYLRENHYSFIIKGIRNSSDFNYEFSMDLANKSISEDLHIDTIFFTPNPETSFISSSFVKDLILYSKQIDKFVPDGVSDIIYSNISKLK